MTLDSPKEIYLDNAATTSMRQEVVDEMVPYFSENYGNPSSLYSIAQIARDAVDESRENVAKILNCKPSEIIFTSGGTESDNMAIIGVAKALKEMGGHIITTKIEHHAVIHAMEELESIGFRISYLNVDEAGFINLDELESEIKNDTSLVSIMLANNETGAIQDLPKISQIIKNKAKDLQREIYIHSDAVQAAGKLDLDTKKLGIDLMSLSGHKVRGPKGVGCLYLKRGIPISPIIVGGGQERQRRSGTENVPGIVGFSKALALANEEKNKFNTHCRKLTDLLKLRLQNLEYEHIIVTPNEDSLSNILNVCFKGFEGEPILIGLDMEGIFASSGSACSSASLEPSHVLVSMGIDPKLAVGSIRFSFSYENTPEDVEFLIESLENVLSELSMLAQS
ncbi:MAG: cysteine desulfurase NifS [Dehalococcoidia bacterium]|nr:cysteine desulfurase NifS [Dehalococcoidia bacterium]|tara:strand:+ start:22561 stop:23745 length:1185 start_codon:yes stop_codon:yes gene_type:complete